MRARPDMLATRALGALTLGLLASTAACTADTSAQSSDESDLTSVTARSRTLEFAGTVYVPSTATADEILKTVRIQAQTAFGPMRTSEVAVQSRELRNVDASTFVKRKVTVVDASGQKSDMLEVKYTYKDDAIVGVSLAQRSSVPLALMNPSYGSQTQRLLVECTRNDSEAREFSASAWYVFEPSLPQCQDAIRKEQQKVDADRAKLANPQAEVAKSEVDRLYLPITVKLGADRTNRGDSYPDYHRLYKGGVKPDKLVVSLVYGMIDHDGATPSGDLNWGELMATFSEVVDAQGELNVVAGPDPIDLTSFKLSSGKVVEKPAFSELVKLRMGTSSLALSSDEKAELNKLFAERIYQKWLVVERPIKVAIGNEQPRDFAIQYLVYWGAGSDPTPHKFATKNSDVFLYNGHSSIGYGPLDPRNFTKSDFPASYQLFWIDGCVSYNYYNHDYLPLKQGGTKNLDLITNGIEAPAWRSGHAMGQFLSTLLNGKSASYKDLLLAAHETEALRVVDGELDNEFRPDRYRVTITKR